MPETAITELFKLLQSHHEEDPMWCAFPLLRTVQAAKNHAKRINKAFPVLHLTLYQRLLAQFYGFKTWYPFAEAVRQFELTLSHCIALLCCQEVLVMDTQKNLKNICCVQINAIGVKVDGTYEVQT